MRSYEYPVDYSLMSDTELLELVFLAEDRLERPAAEEIARRRSLEGALAQIIMDKNSWVAELPEWWAVVHATYLLGFRGGARQVVPLLAALRWADAFDCDWVTELLPSIFGRIGPAAISGLKAVAADPTAGISARDLAMQSLAAVSLGAPEVEQEVFGFIGAVFMDPSEERVLRQLAGHILLDFRRQEYRMALITFAREQARIAEPWEPPAFGPEHVEWTFRDPVPEIWHYRQDWMSFYDPGEIQRRQKRWYRDRVAKAGRGGRIAPGGGKVLPLWGEGLEPEDGGE